MPATAMETYIVSARISSTINFVCLSKGMFCTIKKLLKNEKMQVIESSLA